MNTQTDKQTDKVINMETNTQITPQEARWCDGLCRITELRSPTSQTVIELHSERHIIRISFFI